MINRSSSALRVLKRVAEGVDDCAFALLLDELFSPREVMLDDDLEPWAALLCAGRF